MAKRIPVSKDVFVFEWNAAESIDSFCQKMGISRKSANNRASELRSFGLPVKRWKRPREFHGFTHKHRLYRIWSGMIKRCSNPECKDYKDYGKLGIFVCDLWRFSFVAFRDWSLENGYSSELTIDRIKNEIGYSPENCRWATQSNQNMNKLKRKTPTSSKFKGVSWISNVRKWLAYTCVDGKTERHGMFNSEVEAARMYDRMAIARFGEFACLNFSEILTEENE